MSCGQYPPALARLAPYRSGAQPGLVTRFRMPTAGSATGSVGFALQGACSDIGPLFGVLALVGAGRRRWDWAPLPVADGCQQPAGQQDLPLAGRDIEGEAHRSGAFHVGGQRVRRRLERRPDVRDPPVLADVGFRPGRVVVSLRRYGVRPKSPAALDWSSWS
jgi:hypothetical protein